MELETCCHPVFARPVNHLGLDLPLRLDKREFRIIKGQTIQTRKGARTKRDDNSFCRPTAIIKIMNTIATSVMGNNYVQRRPQTPILRNRVPDNTAMGT